MKTTNLLFIFVAIMSLTSCGQLHVVTLYVDTTNIEQGTIAANANFGQPIGISNEDFTTHVRKRDRIIWDAVSVSNPSDNVEITSINHISGDRIFERKTGIILPESFTDKGITQLLVATKIRTRPAAQKAYLLEKYGLEFTVTGKEGTFLIDPVLKAYR
ncbi:MAG: hypothetical protein JSV59_05370 [Flavobacteriaceae bacterium]|nr:MAG: hypothetical protein JSV59_05370 [Flavobacteriaceae bacterium]